jgi:hypothetical protein
MFHKEIAGYFFTKILCSNGQICTLNLKNFSKNTQLFLHISFNFHKWHLKQTQFYTEMDRHSIGHWHECQLRSTQ